MQQALLDPSSVLRLSDTVIQITVPRTLAYEIDAPETVGLAVPEVCTLARQWIVVREQLQIKPQPGQCVVSGGIFSNNTE